MASNIEVSIPLNVFVYEKGQSKKLPLNEFDGVSFMKDDRSKPGVVNKDQNLIVSGNFSKLNRFNSSQPVDKDCIANSIYYMIIAC